MPALDSARDNDRIAVQPAETRRHASAARRMDGPEDGMQRPPSFGAVLRRRRTVGSCNPATTRSASSGWTICRNRIRLSRKSSDASRLSAGAGAFCLLGVSWESSAGRFRERFARALQADRIDHRPYATGTTSRMTWRLQPFRRWYSGIGDDPARAVGKRSSATCPP